MSRTQRIKTGGRLVEKHNLRIQSQSPGQTRPFFHPAAYFGRIIFLKTGKPHLSKPERRNGTPYPSRQGSIIFQRKHDVFRQRAGRPEGPALKQHADAAHDLRSSCGGCGPEILVAVKNPSRSRRQQAHEDTHQRTFAASAAAHDHEHVAPPYGKGQIMLNDSGTVRYGKPFRSDGDIIPFFLYVHCTHKDTAVNMMVMMDVDMMIPTMELTTAAVVACPTASTLRPAFRP